MRLLWRAVLDTLFPPLCHHCKSPVSVDADLHLCRDCNEKITVLASPLCPRCGTPFATEGGIDHLCGTCATVPPHFAAARGAVLFTSPVRELIHRFKYEKKVHLRRPLGLLTARHLEEFAATSAAELLLPVPLHRRRLRERGFNQALLLGDFLARSWHIPLSRNNLRRTRWTEPQISLSAAERAANVRGAFSVHTPAEVKGKRILLVDDVYTTGSTVSECARTLLREGAAAVYVVTAARAAS